MKNIFLAIVVAIALSACSSENDARRALTAAGFTDIRTHGYSMFACGKDDSFATKFSAKNPQGKPVTGTVCSAWFKGSTIRFD